MQFIKLTKGTDAIKIFNNFGFFKLSIESGEEEPDLTPTPSLVYTLSDDGTYYIVGTGFTNELAVFKDDSGGTNGSGLDNTWVGGQLVIPAEHNGLPVKAIASRAFNGVKNITEVYIYDGITTIGQRAFQCLEEIGFDTTMRACRLPETLTGLGGDYTGGRLFWGRQGLKYIIIPQTATHLAQSIFGYACVKKGNIILNYASGTLTYMFIQFNNGTDYLTSEVDVTINNHSPNAPFAFTGAFMDAHFRNLTFNGFKSLTYNNSPAYFQYTFDGAKIQCVRFNDVETINPGYSSTAFTMTSQRIYFPALQRYNVAISPSAKVDNAFFGYNQCSLNKIENLTIPKLFIKPEYIDWYNSATNWTTFFVNDGNEETRMFVYSEYVSGDTLPTQIGTTQVYNVTWYEDYTLTTPAGSTATANKEYYGKISAVV